MACKDVNTTLGSSQGLNHVEMMVRYCKECHWCSGVSVYLGLLALKAGSAPPMKTCVESKPHI